MWANGAQELVAAVRACLVGEVLQGACPVTFHILIFPGENV